jgi:hypothetical protein
VGLKPLGNGKLNPRAMVNRNPMVTVNRNPTRTAIGIPIFPKVLGFLFPPLLLAQQNLNPRL